MRKTALFLIVSGIIILLLILPAIALAESMPGMDMGEDTAAPAGAEAGIGQQGYKPPEEPADDGSMAAIVSTVFALPIAGWLVVRSLRKAKKNSK